MRKFISKVKKSCHKFMTGKSGFSLVELIVVIAIMAVMAAVLAPALLGYVEKSRMQKDDSAMDEVVNAIQLSLADQEVYDEVLEHSVWDNVSCYIDKKDESQFADCKVQLKAANGDKKEQYMFGDEARLLDETVYYAAGNMRGLTITWSPNESGNTYDFANGILNKFVGRKTGILSENPELYNRLRSVIGDKLDTTSQTYRNSDYTIFIRVGSTGGSEAAMQDAIQVWGQFNGTNLSEKDHKYELSSGRVVGSAGANDATNNQNNNENGNVDFSENYVTPQLTTLTPITWNGLNSITSSGIWTDGTNTYYMGVSSVDWNVTKYSYQLKSDGTWEVKSWSGMSGGCWGADVWTDGTNIYYSNIDGENGQQTGNYILKDGRWVKMNWGGFTDLDGKYIWTDGNYIYYSNGTKQYVLNGNTWNQMPWNGLTSFNGTEIWADGTNVYRSNNTSQYVLNKETRTWEPKIWSGLTNIYGPYVWTDGNYTYYSNWNKHYVLNGNTWETKTWNGNANFYGNSIWTDGTNYYSNNYIFS